MKKIICIFPGIVLVIGLAIIISQWFMGRPVNEVETVENLSTVVQEPGSLVPDEVTGSDRATLMKAIDTPEAFEQSVAGKSPSALLVESEDRPQMLSETDLEPLPKAERKVVPVESLYFWDDFKSLRRKKPTAAAEDIHRKNVVALMKARKLRLDREEALLNELQEESSSEQL